MSAYSLSAAAAVIGKSSISLSSSCHDHHPCLHFLPFKAKPSIKIFPFLNYSLFSSVSSSLINCVHAAAFDSVQLNGEEEKTEVQVEDEENDAVQSAEAGRLYVGNLPFSMTSSQLSEFFAEAGRVVSVEIVYDKVTDRSRGFAFVTMASAEEAKEAIRLFDGAQIGGRSARVNFPEVPRGGEREVMGQKIRGSYQRFVDSPHKLYAGNLSWCLTSQNLTEAFAEQPGFLGAKIVFDRDSGRSRGFGFITFESAEQVESALNTMNGVELEGRPLRLNLVEQRAPVSAPVVPNA